MTEYHSDKLFIVLEKELIKLLSGYNKLLALENGGVDNWAWYDDSLNNFLEQFHKDCPQVCDEEDLDFEVVSMFDLSNYKTLDELITDTKWEIED